MRSILKIIFFFIAVYGIVKMWKETIKDIRRNM